MSRKERDRTIFFVGILFTTFLGVVWLLQDFVSTIVLALVFTIVVHPLYDFFLRKFRMPKGIASFITITIATFLIVMPMIISFQLFAQEALALSADFLKNSDSIIDVITQYIRDFNKVVSQFPVINLQIDAQLIDEIVLNSGKVASNYIVDNAVNIGSRSLQILTNIFIFLILTYFIIPNTQAIHKYLLKVSPLRDNIDALYVNRTIALIVSMIKSIFIIAFAQGLLGGIFLWLAGSQYILTFTILMIILSIIPVVGTPLITIPIAIYMFFQGNTSGAAILMFGQLVFISNIDNILRAELLSRDTALHPALMLLAIIAGLQMFGFIGLIYGPLILIFFLTSLEIYMKHYKM